ncbi:MAG: MXAN_5187 C-terminal domain-containing protein [bacterium]|nr:MXAN_5187 C-terminal domain-containing protein [bacterium]
MENRIRRLEQDIHKLKTAYEQYFSGIERRPPEMLAEKVAREVRTMSSTAITNTALRFRNQQIISRYNTYHQYWQKNLRDLEEGRRPRRQIRGSASSAPEAPADVLEVSTGATEHNQMEKLVSTLSREYQKVGNGKGPDMARLREALVQQTKMVREKYGVDKVVFRVVNEEGKVKIKAAPSRRSKP